MAKHPTQSRLSHTDAAGKARMVDVTAKPVQVREAIAAGAIRVRAATLRLIKANAIQKGDVLNTARIAGILAAKRAADLIPLCHPLPLTDIGVDFDLAPPRWSIVIRACARTTAPTGVEMEALTAVSVAALTIYDMCKGVDQTMVIGDIHLVSKTKQ